MAEDKTPDIMVFRPDANEFNEFAKYVDYMENTGAHIAGIAKVIPPKAWKSKLKANYANVGHITIPNPIQQFVKGMNGVYQQHSKRKKSMNVKEFKHLAKSKYRPPKCSTNEELDKIYWNTITLDERIYGADVSASLFDKDMKVWNLTSLNTILDRVSNDYGLKIEGVNTTYLYFGMWKTSFPWHTEDCDLYSINFLHFGARKVWYAIPPTHGKRFEALVKRLYPANYQACEGFLRHKTTIISPEMLNEYSIPFNKIEQNPGEFIITFPYCYHAGYNAGFNCAEAINFASLRWIDFGKQATKCICSNLNISISMDTFVRTYQSDQYERWLKDKEQKRHLEKNLKISTSPVGPKINLTFIKDNEDTYLDNRLKQKLKGDDEALIKRQKQDLETLSILSNSFMEDSNDIDNEEDSFNIGTWLANYVMYCESRKQEIEINDIMETWAKPLNFLWSYVPRNFEQETSYNRACASRVPHCTVCSMFKRLQDGAVCSPIPRESVPRISSIISTPYINLQARLSCSPSPLLVCHQCGVCIHASCYAEPRSQLPKKKWLCQRCECNEQSLECALCFLRGGAFKKTTNGLWVHVICAIVTQRGTFLSNGDVVLSKKEDNSQMCSFCQGLSGQMARFFTIQCDEVDCTESFHVTCAVAAGVHFTISENPIRIAKICLKHKATIDIAMKTATVMNVNIGQTVIAKNKNGRFYFGTVIDIYTKHLYKVETEHNNAIENVTPKNVKRLSISSEPPKLNEKVTVILSKDENYTAIFKGEISSTHYKVLFEDNSISSIQRGHIYVEGEELPAKVKSKLSIATPMKYNLDE